MREKNFGTRDNRQVDKALIANAATSEMHATALWSMLSI
jgi:hypothetical protein